MAKYDVDYTCGHSERIDLVGKVAIRYRRIETMEKRECPTCRHKNELAAAQKSAKEMQLPPLVGTPKQIAWAESIRAEKLREFNGYNKGFSILGVAPLTIADIPATILAETGARWWIDNRNHSHANEVYSGREKSKYEENCQSRREEKARMQAISDTTNAMIAADSRLI
jgi:hypothetical protein